MRIYAACLASYNSGRLHGVWLDVSSDAEEMREEIAAMLRGSPCPNVSVECPYCEGRKLACFHNSETGDTRQDACPTCQGAGTLPSAEEWAIHDYDDFPNMGEYPGLDAVAEMAALFEDHDEIDAGDLKAILADFQSPEEAREALRDDFCGIFDTFRDYADDFADEQLACEGHKPDSIAARYFDYEAFARDLAFDMRAIDCPSGVAVFWSR